MSSATSQLKPWSEIEHLSNEALIELFEQSTSELHQYDDLGTTRVRLIASDTIIKFPSQSESEAIAVQLVEKHTSILVPAVRRFIPGCYEGENYLVMEYIPGRLLKDCWSELSLWRNLVITWTLRRYVRQLRTVPFWPYGQDSRPGPVGAEPQCCELAPGEIFTLQGAGPFATYAEFTAWWDHKLAVSQREERAPLSVPSFDDTMPLVLTQFDLARRNLILDDANRLWVIDWGCSGFYPKWFESLGMMFDWKHAGRFGHWLVRFVAGYYQKQREFIGHVSWALSTGYLI